jgi:hypothetical protein
MVVMVDTRQLCGMTKTKFITELLSPGKTGRLRGFNTKIWMKVIILNGNPDPENKIFDSYLAELESPDETKQCV